MIRINLLQGTRTRKVRGQWDVRLEVAVAVALVVVVIGSCIVWSSSLSSDIEARRMEQQQKFQQVAQLKQKVKKVQDFEKKKQELESKNRVIEQLEKRRGGPVRVLDIVSQSLEPFKLWLVGLGIDGRKVTIQGRALGNDDVVGFVNNLRRGDQFKRIKLNEIRAKEQAKVKVFEFKLMLKIKE